MGSGYGGPTRAQSRADSLETTIRTSGAFAATAQFTDAVDMSGYDYIDIYINVTDAGTNPAPTVSAQSTGEASPSKWADLLSDDDLTSGATTPSQYVATLDTTGNPKIQLRFAARGLWMRFSVTGAVADGAYSVTAVRRRA
jgi:hypothetical protein